MNVVMVVNELIIEALVKAPYTEVRCEGRKVDVPTSKEVNARHVLVVRVKRTWNTANPAASPSRYSYIKNRKSEEEHRTKARLEITETLPVIVLRLHKKRCVVVVIRC